MSKKASPTISYSGASNEGLATCRGVQDLGAGNGKPKSVKGKECSGAQEIGVVGNAIGSDPAKAFTQWVRPILDDMESLGQWTAGRALLRGD